MLKRCCDTVASAMRYCLPEVIGSDSALLTLSEEADENVIGLSGHIRICRTMPVCFVQTCVRGELNAARRTALERLTGYLHARNLGVGAVLGARPVVQEPLAPDTWLVRIGLHAANFASIAPAPLTSDVEIAPREAETIAVLRVSGWPRYEKIIAAESAILMALSGSDWRKAGAWQLRLHCPAALLPFMGSFEAVIPVAKAPPQSA